MIIKVYIYVIVQLSVALNNYNYVLKYSRQPTETNLSNLCKVFHYLSICEEYNQHRNNNWYVVRPTLLDSYRPSAINREYRNKFSRGNDFGHCVCKCCKCPHFARNRKVYRTRRDFENDLQVRRNIFKKQRPYIRKMFSYANNRRSKHPKKRFDFNNLFQKVKNSTKDTYEKAVDTVQEVAVNTYQKAKHKVEEVYDETKFKVKSIAGTLTPEENCTEFLHTINAKLEILYHDNILAQWNYESNLTEANKFTSLQSDIKFSMKMKEFSEEIKKFDKAVNCSCLNATMQRQILFLTKLHESALPMEEYAELQNILRSMESIFSKAVIQDYTKKSRMMHLEPDITDHVAHCRDPKELEYIWEAWRDETGNKLKRFYPRYIELMTKAANLNGFDNVAEMWASVYEQENFEEEICDVWEQISPLYQLLHAYVRHKLRKFYGPQIVQGQYIPAHLLGNIFGQTWINLYNITIPFPENKFPDITAQLQSKGYDSLKMFKEAEHFFKSLGLPSMTSEFWNKSILEPRYDISMVCHASAWDMYNKKDFRIKMCTHITFEDFIVIHHEMGHVEYYMLYKDLPVVFREGANPGFHEAIGDTIALSVSTPSHIQSLGLQEETHETCYEDDINFLFMMALQKVAFIPYSLVVEKWRWNLFKGKIDPEDYNRHWWKLRQTYQGIVPPKPRGKDNFDAGGKYHIAAGVPYIRYFVSFVIQFQFHEALCKIAHEQDIPLHKCDIYKSQKAGAVLKEALSLGRSVPWKDVMFKITGKTEMSATSLLKYFNPLEKWLKQELENDNITIGWNFYNNIK